MSPKLTEMSLASNFRRSVPDIVLLSGLNANSYLMCGDIEAEVTGAVVSYRVNDLNYSQAAEGVEGRDVVGTHAHVVLQILVADEQWVH